MSEIETWKVLCYVVSDYKNRAAEELDVVIAAAEERGRRSVELGTCRVYRHGCADGRASESRLSDRWREHALPHPKRDNCVDWVALAPRDSGKGES